MTSTKGSVPSSPKAKRVSLGVGGALVELSQDPKRGSWASPVEFILSCIGYAVGIGNVWRFPYLVYRNGGGAFLLPFILMLITMGLPIFFLELVIGQYSGLGPNEAFARMAPALHGVGYCTLVVIFFVMIYYMVIVAWTLFYIFVSFMPKLRWAYCDNDFNTNNCYSGLQQIECQKDDPGTIFYNRTCLPAELVCRSFGYYGGGNVTHCFDGDRATPLRGLYTRVLSSEEYFKYVYPCMIVPNLTQQRTMIFETLRVGIVMFVTLLNDYVLGVRGATWEHFGGIRWELLGCLTLAWIICFLCLIRGVQSIGKVVYFTALFPYIMLTALLIRGVTLDGAADGTLWFITPTWSTLGSATVWADAASQVFYSLGIGCGSLITLSSYSNFTNNCHRDAIFVTFANLLTSIFAGFAIFSIMGFLAHEMQVPIDEVVKSETGLAFIAYPEAVVRMHLPNLWAVLFFVMLFILGLGSQFAGVQAINTAILDLRPDLRKHESYVVLGICVTCWLLAVPMVFDGGVYLFKLMDWNTASWAILLIGTAEVGAAAWCYGCNKFLCNIAEMQMRFGCLLRNYWWLSWFVLAPITCLGVFVYQIYTYQLPYYGKYIFPDWANAIGILIGLSTLAPMPFFLIRHLWNGPRDRSLFRPTKSWGPAAEKGSGNDTPSTASIKMAEASGDQLHTVDAL